jgi:hypothetical protein
MVFTSLLDELQTDPWPVPPRHRPLRSTGLFLFLRIYYKLKYTITILKALLSR